MAPLKKLLAERRWGGGEEGGVPGVWEKGLGDSWHHLAFQGRGDKGGGAPCVLEEGWGISGAARTCMNS